MDKNDVLLFLLGGIALGAMTGLALRMVLRHQLRIHSEIQRADIEDLFKDHEQAMVNHLLRADGKPVRGVYNRQTGEFVHLTVVDDEEAK